MKKRNLMFLLALSCLLAFSACKKESPLTLYNNAMTALESAEGFEAKVNMKIDMTMDGETEHTETTMDMKVHGNNVAMTMTIPEIGSQEILYVDSVMYMDMGALGKFKYTMTPEEFEEQAGTMDASDFPTVTKEDLKSVEWVTEGENKSFTVALDPASVNSIVESALGDTAEALNATVSNIQMTVTFGPEDQLMKIRIQMTADYAMEQIGAVSTNIDMTYEFLNVGTIPAVTAPSNADQYLDMPVG